MNDEPRPGLNDSPLPPPTWPTRSRPPVLTSAGTDAADVAGAASVLAAAVDASALLGGSGSAAAELEGAAPEAAALASGAGAAELVPPPSSESPHAASRPGTPAASPITPAARNTSRR